jgi:hypothetical protein
MDQRRSALHGRRHSRGAPLCDHAAARAAEAAACLGPGRPGRLGNGGECLWGQSVATAMVGGAPPRPCRGHLGKSLCLACWPATAGHNDPGSVGGGGVVSVAGWRRGPRSSLVGLEVAPPGRAAAAPLATVALGAPSLSAPTELTAYVVCAPPVTVLETVVPVAGSRWTVARCCEAATGEVGLAQYAVRSWTGGDRPLTLAMWASALLTALRAAHLPTAPP